MLYRSVLAAALASAVAFVSCSTWRGLIGKQSPSQFAAESPAAATSATATVTAPSTPSPTTAPKPARTPNPKLLDPFNAAAVRINEYRKLVKLPPIRENPALDYADFNHARYLVENEIDGGDLTLDGDKFVMHGFDPRVHFELRDKKGYTLEGDTAAGNASVMSAPRLDFIGPQFVDGLMRLPFVSLRLIDPQLSQVGFGDFCAKDRCDALLTIRRGIDRPQHLALYGAGSAPPKWDPILRIVLPQPGRLLFPIGFPSDGSTVPNDSYQGSEWPDPLSACPGYIVPTGSPISLQLGLGKGPNGAIDVTAHSLSSDGQPVEHCVIDAATYNNPDAAQTESAKSLLNSMGAIILLPRAPLKAGPAYSVSITADGTTYSWSFKITGKL